MSTDNDTALNNGGVKRMRDRDQSIEFRDTDDLIKAQREQDRKAGNRRTFTRAKPKR